MTGVLVVDVTDIPVSTHGNFGDAMNPGKFVVIPEFLADISNVCGY